jgi:hypothetical protein
VKSRSGKLNGCGESAFAGSRLYTGQSAGMRDSVGQLRAVFFIRSRLTLPKGEGRLADRNLAAAACGRPSHQRFCWRGILVAVRPRVLGAAGERGTGGILRETGAKSTSASLRSCYGSCYRKRVWGLAMLLSC